MNIALIGYGKMGQTIEREAQKKGHNILLRVTSANTHELDTEHLQNMDVAIEFTRPEAAKANVLKCLEAGVNVVCGTTGWNEQVPEAEQMAVSRGLAFLHASNFSVGVNIFFEINKLLATLMSGHPEYNITVKETHHTQKKDAPSGTAITIAEQILERTDRKKRWVLNDINHMDAIPIFAHRVENVPGTHRVSYNSQVDSIEISHVANNRDGFAHGAVLAAEYIAGKQGIFTIKDVLGIK